MLCDDVKQPSPPLPADDDIEEDVLRCVHREKDFISLLSSTPGELYEYEYEYESYIHMFRHTFLFKRVNKTKYGLCFSFFKVDTLCFDDSFADFSFPLSSVLN